MDIAALTAELTLDPEALGYAGKTAQQVADLLNAPRAESATLRKLQPVEIMDTVGLAAYTVLRKRTLNADINIAGPSLVVTDYLQSSGDEGLSIAAGSPFRAALLAAGITAFLAQALLDLATVERSRAEELGLGVVGDGHVRSCVGTEWEVT